MKRMMLNTLFQLIAIVCLLMLFAGCMTYVKQVDLANSPVHIEGIRASAQAQVGVQTRGQHIPGSSEEVEQEGGGRADTQATVPIQVDRSTTTPAASDAPAVTPVNNVTNVSSTATDAADGLTLSFRYGGFNGSGAVLDPGLVLSNATFSASGITYSHTAYPSSWDGNAIACLFVVDGANATGGKFEWAPPERTSRAWDNIRNGYSGGGNAWVEPADGAAVAYGIWSTDGTRRSNLVFGTWKRQ